MAYLRVSLIGLTLILFFTVAVPLQLVAAWLRRPWRDQVAVVFCRILIRLVRVRVETRGAPAAGGPLLIAANHISWIDIVALASVAPFCFLAKREVGLWPLIGSFARRQGTIFVDRTRRRSIPSANAAMVARMLDGRRVLLFPEGTTGDGQGLRKFHSSHFAAARDLLAKASGVETVAVQPVAISYSTPKAAWLGDASLLPHLWSVLTGEPIRCALVFGEPFAYERGADRKFIAREAAARIAALRSAPLARSLRTAPARECCALNPS